MVEVGSNGFMPPFYVFICSVGYASCSENEEEQEAQTHYESGHGLHFRHYFCDTRVLTLLRVLSNTHVLADLLRGHEVPLSLRESLFHLANDSWRRNLSINF